MYDILPRGLSFNMGMAWVAQAIPQALLYNYIPFVYVCYRSKVLQQTVHIPLFSSWLSLFYFVLFLIFYFLFFGLYIHNRKSSITAEKYFVTKKINAIFINSN